MHMFFDEIKSLCDQAADVAQTIQRKLDAFDMDLIHACRGGRVLMSSLPPLDQKRLHKLAQYGLMAVNDSGHWHPTHLGQWVRQRDLATKKGEA